MSWFKVMSAEELPRGTAQVVPVDGERLVFCKLSNDEVYCVEDSCSHDDGPLGDGMIHGEQIECPRHGARFDLRTGAATRMPAAAPIDTFPIRVVDGWIEVELGADR